MAPPTRLDLVAILSNLFISSTLRTHKKSQQQQHFNFFPHYERMDKHFFLLTDFFSIHQDVLEINRLDKIARRSKRVGGAIADLWGPKKSPLFRMVKRRQG